MTITVEHSNPKHATVWLDRPKKLNAFDDATIDELLQAFDQLAKDSTLRVITLAGRGKHFCAGADLEWMKKQGQQSAEENRAGAQKLAKLMQQIDQQPQVVIARVQGAAFGGALGLICAAHIVIGADNIRFCLSEAKLGLLPAVISPYVVRAMGQRQARRYFASAELIQADDAKRLGLVHEIVPLDELDAHCNAMVEQLLAASPAAQRQVRELVELADGKLDKTLIDATCDYIVALRTSPDGQEGMSAFLEKRQPNWIETK